MYLLVHCYKEIELRSGSSYAQYNFLFLFATALPSTVPTPSPTGMPTVAPSQQPTGHTQFRNSFNAVTIDKLNNKDWFLKWFYLNLKICIVVQIICVVLYPKKTKNIISLIMLHSNTQSTK